jgi:hypothetical protein
MKKNVFIVFLVFLLAACTTENTQSDIVVEKPNTQTPKLALDQDVIEPSDTPLPSFTPSLEPKQTPNNSFYKLFKNVPIVRFNSNQNAYDDGTIGEIEYFGGAGPSSPLDEYLLPNGVYEPLDDLWLEICADSPDQLQYEYSKSSGEIVFSGTEPLIEYDQFTFTSCASRHGAYIPIPEYLSTHLGEYNLSFVSKNNINLFIQHHNSIEYFGTNSSFSFAVEIPDEPRLYFRDNDHKLYLINFYPNEFVNIYCRDKKVISNVFRTNDVGRLVVDNFSCSISRTLVQGVQTGLVSERHLSTSIVAYRKTWEPFPGSCPQSRLDEGDITQVSNTPPVCSNIRKQPYKTGEKIECVDPGTILQVLDGPKCNDGLIWWNVKTKYTEDTIIGWAAEGDNQNFWLLPGVLPNYSGDANPMWPHVYP